MDRYTAPENDYRPLEERLQAAPDLAVSVVIPVYNRVDLLRRTLAGLTNQTHPNLTVVVADDGSEEDVEGCVAEFRDTLTIDIAHQDHDGYGAGRARNLGASRATGDVLVFIDADCVPAPGLVAAHARWHAVAGNLVVIGSRHHLDTTDLSVEAIRSGELPAPSGRPADFRRVFYRRTTDLRFGDEAYRALVSSNFSVRTELFHAVGGFSDLFRRWGGEDTELGWRLFSNGAFIIPDNEAVIFHQTQIDGAEGWREEARRHNDALIQTLIPHRFYRKPRPGAIFAVPKVSWVIDPVVPERVEALWDAILAQNFDDAEVLLVGDDATTTRLDELAVGDPRLHRHSDLHSALQSARGEYVALLHGWATPDHRLAGRAARRLDSRPRASLLSVGYQVPGPDGPLTYRHERDTADIERAWSDRGLPVFAFARRREWAKALGEAADPVDAWRRLTEFAERHHLTEGLVALPAAEPRDDLPVDYPAYASDRSKLLRDLRAKPDPRHALPTLGTFAKRRLQGMPYQTAPTDGRLTTDAPLPERPRVRYVGWVGKENLGDEALLHAIEQLMPWGDIETAGDPAELLLLGGGTLINRKVYLDWLRQKDSPRSERAVFGTGVAHPDFWGVTEPTQGWIDFLSSCVYVGVRGPQSAELLDAWGYGGELEIVGDPALALLPPAESPARRSDVITVVPARANGELWGGSDQAVFDALAGLVGRQVDAGRTVRFLSCFPADDRPIFEIMRAAGHPGLDYLAGYRDEAAALSWLAESGVVVAERLHGAVLAAACGAPFISLEYRPKLRDFARSVEMEEFLLRTDDLAGLGERFDDLVGRQAEVAERMLRHVDHYRGRLQNAADRIREAVT